jgi:hypothetical protein
MAQTRNMDNNEDLQTRYQWIVTSIAHLEENIDQHGGEITSNITHQITQHMAQHMTE